MTHQSLHQLLGQRWAIPILSALQPSPLRFAGLRSAIPGVSQRMLVATARTLAEAGLTTRVEVFLAARRRQVTYSITDRGVAVLRWSGAAGFDWVEVAS